jgi:hypothetical protein
MYLFDRLLIVVTVLYIINVDLLILVKYVYILLTGIVVLATFYITIKQVY